jgi:ornithine cyclodeaminase/alanine dehydrogenase-like protein (mu-crystallin family)
MPRTGRALSTKEGWLLANVARVKVLDDAAVEAAVTPALAVAAARDAVRAAAAGELIAPPRQRVPAGETDFVFTVGGTRRGGSGFRVYGLWPGESDQLVAVWQPGGRLLGLVVGSRLGQYRTGALGAVAIEALTPPRALRVAVVGTGAQAWAQLWAATAVREMAEAKVFGRDPRKTEAFRDRARRDLGVNAVVADSARRAVAGADCVIVATRSSTPVVEAGWLPPGCHVNSVGRADLDPAVVRDAAVIVSDSPEQLRADDDPRFRDVRHLGEPIDRPEGLSVYASIGLAGSEVVLAERLLQR